MKYNVNPFRCISKQFFFQTMCQTYKIRPEVSDNDFIRRGSSFKGRKCLVFRPTNAV